ncbi:MAG: aminomethyl-transferring glycine dehydrogenase subunit GcvPB [Fervidicoccaceae archaeon]
MRYRQADWDEPLIFELPLRERTGFAPLGEVEVQLVERVLRELGELARESLELPSLSELEVVRHFTRLSQQSFGVDTGTTPLGSCTMKYNPRLAWKMLLSEELAELHQSMLELESSQGVLELLYELQTWFSELTGLPVCSLHPPAGASGELAGVLMIKAYQRDKGRAHKDEILIPDSAHGSNPASAAMGGFRVVRIPTGRDGLVDLEALRFSATERTAGMMLTNPNTLGLFEERVTEICDIVHGVGGLMYYDGANLNGIMGWARPADMGFDIAHLNVHKTFSAPHGSGGPGAGVLCCTEELAEYLPGYVIAQVGGRYVLRRPSRSVGDMTSSLFNLPALIYAYIFILGHGLRGLREAAANSVASTNYFIKLIEGVDGIDLPMAPSKPRMHEVVLSAKKLAEETGVTANDVAKFLLDQGLHAPITYFPLIIEEALMIEFTETEPLEIVELYAKAIKDAIKLARENPAHLKNAPSSTSRRRLDLVRANHPLTLSPSYRVEKRGVR